MVEQLDSSLLPHMVAASSDASSLQQRRKKELDARAALALVRAPDRCGQTVAMLGLLALQLMPAAANAPPAPQLMVQAFGAGALQVRA